jgi:hypothetical protein
MDQIQQRNAALDQASEPELTDTEIVALYTTGLISRAEADVFQILAAFHDGNDDDESLHCCLI